MSEKTNTSTIETDSGQLLEIPSVLPLVPLRDLVVYPYMMFPLVVSESGLLRLADEALEGNKLIALFTVGPEEADETRPSSKGAKRGRMGSGGNEEESGGGAWAERVGSFSDLSPLGTAAMIHKMLRFPDGGMRLLVQGVARVRLLSPEQREPYMKGRVEVLTAQRDDSRRGEALRRNAQELFSKLVDGTGYLSEELKVVVLNIEDTGRLADFLGANLNLKLPEKLAILEELDPARRLERVTGLMVRELDILDLGKRIQSQVQSEMESAQREFYLRQQLKAIQKELGGTEENPELEELKERIEAADMPAEAHEAATKEYERLTRMPPQAAEYTVSMTYIDWMLQVPWTSVERPPIDIDRAEKVLDEDHYDLEEVKARFLEYLAVRKLNQHPKSPILCLAGPPGVGKTSLGQSIARALDRPFTRLSLGGLHDEAEIRGHRRTYIGSMPGRIIQGIVASKAPDPVFMLDEIDKVGADFRGDPTSALLEVLDPAQNSTFRDNYLGVAVDLSRVLFITTANALFSISRPLLDRMEVIELPGYTTADKIQIARRYLVPRALEDNGVSSKQVRFTKSALATIATDYTREAGVRNLERGISQVARKIATRVARGKKVNVSINRKNLPEYLGKPKIFRETRERRDRLGVVTGLAWTPFGGEILFVEATRMAGRGSLILTGQLGGVMRESAQAALSYVRSLLGRSGEKDGFEGFDYHIHVPAGAMPKDGPSAGVAMVTAIASLAMGRRVRSDTAMTGEISLRGNVLPIGGVKQKVLGARRAGIRRVILPVHNEPDLEEVPEEIRDEVEFILVDSIDKVLEHALRPHPGKAKSELRPSSRKRAKPRATRGAPGRRKRAAAKRRVG